MRMYSIGETVEYRKHNNKKLIGKIVAHSKNHEFYITECPKDYGGWNIFSKHSVYLENFEKYGDLTKHAKNGKLYVWGVYCGEVIRSVPTKKINIYGE